MHRIARIVPIVMAVLVATVVGILVARGRPSVVESAPQPVAHADLQMRQADIEEQSGTVRWHLVADQALVYQSESRTALRKISVVVQDADRTWTIVADEGEVREPTPRGRTVEIRKNVVVTSSDGMRLETTVLRWESATKRLWTDQPVRIVRDGAVIDGSSFEMKMDAEEATVRGRVHAMFAESRRP